MKNTFWNLLFFISVPLKGSFEENFLKKCIEQTDSAEKWIEELNAFSEKQFSTTNLENTSPSFPLFINFPALKDRFTRLPLAHLPTPIHKIDLFENDKINLFIKRDDLTGKYEKEEHQYGGNKIRKLEFLLAQALKQRAKTIFTFGAAGSNHATATAWHSKILGLKVILFLLPQFYSHTVEKNILLNHYNNAEMRFFENPQERKKAAGQAWLEEYNKQGNFPYIIPTGGSNPLGTLGFVNAAFELKEQIQAGLLPEPAYIYVPSGSGATAAGLILGCKAAGLSSKVIGVCVIKNEKLLRQKVLNLLHETNLLLHNADASFPLFAWSNKDITLKSGCTGNGYGIPTPASEYASILFKNKTGISLEQTYTAKALAGLIDDYHKGFLDKKTILFWNTYCGFDFSQELSEINKEELPESIKKHLKKKA